MMVPDRQSLDVLLMGHSHFHWLNEFVRKDVEPRYRDFAVSLNGCRAVSFYTKRGGRVADFAPRHATEKIRKLLPDIVILCMGGNDIDSRDVNHKPQAVGMKVFQLASSLIRIGVNQVGVCQVFPRKKWRKLLRREGDRAVEIINAACENHPKIFSGSTLVGRTHANSFVRTAYTSPWRVTRNFPQCAGSDPGGRQEMHSIISSVVCFLTV